MSLPHTCTTFPQLFSNFFPFFYQLPSNFLPIFFFNLLKLGFKFSPTFSVFSRLLNCDVRAVLHSWFFFTCFWDQFCIHAQKLPGRQFRQPNRVLGILAGKERGPMVEGLGKPTQKLPLCGGFAVHHAHCTSHGSAKEKFLVIDKI